MKILFVLGNVYPHDDANSLIVNRLARELVKSGSDSITVHELGVSGNEGDIAPKRVGNIVIHSVSLMDKGQPSERLSEALKTAIQWSRIARLFLLAKHPRILIEYLIMRVHNGSVSKKYAIEIRRICGEENIDVIVGVSFPFYTCLGVVRARLKIPFIYYQLDPYFSHYLQPNKYMSILQEAFVCRKAVHIIMTDLIRQDYLSSPLRRYLDKASVVCFPAIEIAGGQQESKTRDEGSTIRLVYVGTLYEDIRSPKYFFDLVEGLVGQGTNVHADIVGPIVGNIDTTLNPQHFAFHGRVSAAEANAYMQSADVLVNIGNTITNQMPSKIFEYFSTGKPILNICKREKCPTLNYSRRYPYCLNVQEQREINELLLSEIGFFFAQCLGKKLSSSEIRALYPEWTTDEVAKSFMRVVNFVQ